MTNPILAEATRGALTESVHRGAYAVVDAAGGVVDAAGAAEAPAFLRSALKVLQALPLVESGAADAAGLGPRALALATSSHSGAPEHIALAEEMLAAGGFTKDALGCGADWPGYRLEDTASMGRRGETPSALHHTCSGKHAGFLLAAQRLGLDPAAYLDPQGAFQTEVRAVVEEMTGAADQGGVAGAVDGCSAPAFALPLTAVAGAFARISVGIGMAPRRAAAAGRLLEAAMAEPWYVAGEGRACTEIMAAGRGRIYAKTGARGAYVAALPREGLGIAIKIDDGAGPAAEATLARLALERLGDPPAALAAVLAGYAQRPLRNSAGTIVGETRATAPKP